MKYPFAAVDAGTSVEIFHGNHGQLETRSPVYTLVPYAVDGTPHLIAGYLCTPLVKFPMNSLQAGGKVRGTTIAELGNRNRPDRHVRVPAGRQGLPVDVQHQPRRHEDPDEPVCDGRPDYRSGQGGEGGGLVPDHREPEGRRADGPVRPVACARAVPQRRRRPAVGRHRRRCPDHETQPTRGGPGRRAVAARRLQAGRAGSQPPGHRAGRARGSSGHRLCRGVGTRPAGPRRSSIPACALDRRGRRLVRVDVLPAGSDQPGAGLPAVAGAYAVDRRGASASRRRSHSIPACAIASRSTPARLPGGSPGVTTAIVGRPAQVVDRRARRR